MYSSLIWMHVCCRFADGDEVDYHAFLAGINWVEHLAPPVMPEDILKVRERKKNKGSREVRRGKLTFQIRVNQKSTGSDFTVCAQIFK